jgi:hypothetical protein
MPNRKTMKTAEYEKLNEALYLWFTQQLCKWSEQRPGNEEWPLFMCHREVMCEWSEQRPGNREWPWFMCHREVRKSLLCKWSEQRPGNQSDLSLCVTGRWGRACCVSEVSSGLATRVTFIYVSQGGEEEFSTQGEIYQSFLSYYVIDYCCIWNGKFYIYCSIVKSHAGQLQSEK